MVIVTVKEVTMDDDSWRLGVHTRWSGGGVVKTHIELGHTLSPA